VRCCNRRGLRAVASLDELRFCEAYMRGDIDVHGSMYELLRLRGLMRDVRPLRRLGALVYRRLLNTGGFRKKWIAHHYDEPIELFASFLDAEHRCYSHGFFVDEDEPLEQAMSRKLDFALSATRLGPNMRVLDIGGGWGSFLRYAGHRGIHVTSLTISPKQYAWMNRVIGEEALPCRVLMQDVYAYRVSENERFDAIVNLGVTEHLTNYEHLASQYRHLLRPGGRIYFDSCASNRMYDVGSFIAEHIFPGTTSYLCVHRFLAAAARYEFEIELIQNDRLNYWLTTKKWGERLEANREHIVRHAGEATFRKFRLLIWACAAMFDLKVVTAYRVVLRG
jgi:cyclopropane-fatty-acyl-phospholipid synthase